MPCEEQESLVRQDQTWLIAQYIQSRRIAMFDPTKSFRKHREEANADFERRYIAWLLEAHKQNLSQAAHAAQMDRKHLLDLSRKHGLR
jgi:DNA-binding NtrC family response regulator